MVLGMRYSCLIEEYLGKLGNTTYVELVMDSTD